MRLNKVQNVESVDCFIQWRRELNVPVIELKKNKNKEKQTKTVHTVIFSAVASHLRNAHSLLWLVV